MSKVHPVKQKSEMAAKFTKKNSGVNQILFEMN